MPTLTPQQQETRAFLILLDPGCSVFNFRTFDDKKCSDRRGLTGNFSGSINNVESTLVTRNAECAGVSVVINEGGQRKDKSTVSDCPPCSTRSPGVDILLLRSLLLLRAYNSIDTVLHASTSRF